MNYRNYKVSIGIEIHTVLNINRKVFSCEYIDKLKTNNIDNVDLAMPGYLPTINIDAVKKAVKLAKILNCNITNEIIFVRKNYFYLDLPKGFQLTQFEKYFATDGKVAIFIGNKWKDILIRNIQIEEDTAKQYIRKNKKIELDYNRCGKGLLEIITKPIFDSANEVIAFLKIFQNILIDNNISNSSLENGDFRVDINISLSDSNILNNRVEIKNLNSYKNMKKAIKQEVELQLARYKEGKKIISTTKNYNENTNTLEIMRQKTTQYGYFFTTEPNLPVICINSIIERYKNYSLSDNSFYNIYRYICNNFTNSLEYINIMYSRKDILNFLIKYFDQNLDFIHYVFKFLVNTKLGIEKNNAKCNNFYLLLKENKISQLILDNHIYKNLFFQEFLKSDYPSIENISKNILEDVILENDIYCLVDKIINDNNDKWKKYNSNPKKYNRFFIGLIMKETKGKCDFAKINEYIQKKAKAII